MPLNRQSNYKKHISYLKCQCKTLVLIIGQCLNPESESCYPFQIQWEVHTDKASKFTVKTEVIVLAIEIPPVFDMSALIHFKDR